MEKELKNIPITQLTNNIINDMKSLSGVLQPISKTLYQNNNTILNELLVAKQQQTHELIKKLLSHSLQIAQHKNLSGSALNIISKVITCTKSIKWSVADENDKSAMEQILYQITNIISLVSVQQSGQDSSLRVVQTSFSLIDQSLIQFFKVNILTSTYSVFFGECRVNMILKNICVSGLFALTQCLFSYGPVKQSFEILQSFLHYLYNNKKYTWIKGNQIKGLIWDLTVVAVKNLSANHLIQLQNMHQIQKLLTKMYEISCQFIFLKKRKDFYNVASQSQKNNKHAQDISDFIRYFKAYVSISSSLSIEAFRVLQKQYVSFRATIPNLMLICDLERNSRMYIFLEAICQLLLNQYDLPLSFDKGIVMIEILSKISEQLCLCNESIGVPWQNNQYYLDKICHEQPKISDSDFVRLIKSTIFQLRLKYQKDQDLIQCKNVAKQSARSITNLPENMGNTKKWEIFIKCIIRTVRYLSSLGFTTKDFQEDPTRKIILQLQYWFLICPSYRAKNMILQQLLVTANLLTNKLQAIKVSQCVQIGSNILYGYYEDMDSIGLTIILKMMAGVKADWEEGKSFEELDQIYNLTIEVFKELNLIKTEAQFSMTIQAIVQCANSLLADLQQPKQKLIMTTVSPIKRQYKMIEYIIQRLLLVIKNNISFAASEWNFITAFFITLCYNKNTKVRQNGIQKIGILVNDILASHLQSYMNKKQQDIMGLYLELSKAHIKQIEMSIIEQLKSIMPRIEQQSALMDGFRIAKIFTESEQDKKQMISSIHELQQILIKQCLFRIVDRKYLKMILDGFQVKFAQKNQQYRLLNLYWNISDHFRQIMTEGQVSKDFVELWEHLFKNIWVICQASRSSQTKQSAIHVTTQILGESSHVVQFDFILSMISKYYQPMVLLLLGIHPSSFVEIEKTSQTSKIALKNSIKTFKKLISKEKKTEQQKQGIIRNIISINQPITKYISNHATERKVGNLSIQLLLELSNYILNISQDKSFEGYQLESSCKQMFQAIEDVIKMCEQHGDKIDTKEIDLKSHLYKKKLKPVLEKITDIYKKGVIAQEQNEGK